MRPMPGQHDTQLVSPMAPWGRNRRRAAARTWSRRGRVEALDGRPQVDPVGAAPVRGRIGVRVLDAGGPRRVRGDAERTARGSTGSGVGEVGGSGSVHRRPRTTDGRILREAVARRADGAARRAEGSRRGASSRGDVAVGSDVEGLDLHELWGARGGPSTCTARALTRPRSSRRLPASRSCEGSARSGFAPTSAIAGRFGQTTCRASRTMS